VENSGSGPAGASTIRYYLSLDQIRNVGDRRQKGSLPVGPLASLETSTGEVVVTIFSDTPAKTYYLLACADDTKVVGESNEKNNCKASASTVDVVIP
jgi:hypothetical protein